MSTHPLFSSLVAALSLSGIASALPNAEFRGVSKATATKPTATVGQGVVLGTTTALPNALAGVNKFLGVPFAVTPPVRFSPPNAPTNFSGSYNATYYRPACVQEFVYPPNSQYVTEGIFNSPPPIAGESEDCLYLNVFAPNTPPPSDGFAVMFWIYGGGYSFGASSLPGYDGSAFAANNEVIVVTHNYRTNVFGFSNSPQIAKGSRNSGYLDQRMALNWVQQNIHAFGGNASKVTIFGESAGGWSVDNLIATYTTKTAPFRAAIMESGQLTYLADPIPTDSTASWNALIAALNCGNQPALACARAAPASKIKSIIEQQMISFSPQVDNVTRSYSPAIRRQNGQFAAVPIMIGSNANEGRVFELGQTNLTAFLETSLHRTAPGLIPSIMKAYPLGNISTQIAGGNAPYDVISQIATLLAFQCGTCLLANLTAHLGVPTWQYYYNATFPNYSPFNGALGVFHSSELPLVFGTYPGGQVQPLASSNVGLLPLNVSQTGQEERLSTYMNAAWAKFAKNPTTGPTWAQNANYMTGNIAILGGNGSSGADLVSGSEIRSPCQLLLPAFTALTGPAYGLPN